MAANMLAVLIILIFRICHSEGATVTAAYSNNDVFSCFPGSPNAIDVTLTCKVTITFSGSVVWSRDATEMKTCSSSSGICVSSIGFSEQRYNFTADLNKKEFYLTITSVNSTIDLATFKCEHGTGDIGTFTIRECVDCTVPSVTNGQTNATSATVAEGTLVVITCDAGYTLEGSSELICQADQTWDNPFPTCTEPPEPPCNLIFCWIIVFGYLVICISLLAFYCVKQLEFDSDSSSFIPAYILPACILTVIGIVVTVVVSRLAEKDCSIGACLVGPMIVSIIESWIPMIVIFIHSKCCGNWKDDKDKTKNKKLADQAVTTGNNGGSSCFGGNNSILPICTGTDQGPQQSLGGVQGDGGQYPAKGQKNKQKPDHGRQKPDGDNGKHLDHGKQHLDHGKLRPLPLAGGDDGLQQNKTEKSGSVVSKGDVDIDEALQFKPRKLPEIPAGGEKSIQGISANFDNPVPDKKRPTPIGKETIEKFDEESPRKKKKKKKKKDKGKDTSVEYDTDV